MPPQPRTLTAIEAKVVLSLEARAAQEVSLDSVQSLGGVSRSHARKLAHDLARKGWLQRARRGLYLFNAGRRGPDAIPDRDPLRVGAHLVRPYYFGYATAAELLGLLPQVGATYYVVTPSRATASPPGPSHFRIVRCASSRFFGIRTLHRREEALRVSDQERTVLDVLDRPEYSGGLPGAALVIASAKSRLDWRKLERYLVRLGNRSLELRLGYLLERVRPEVSVPAAWMRRRLPRASEPYVPLGPPKEFGRSGPHDGRWHIVRNIPEAHLFGEVGVR
jgi:predicted transcriptional regulator of viral defense system